MEFNEESQLEIKSQCYQIATVPTWMGQSLDSYEDDAEVNEIMIEAAINKQGPVVDAFIGKKYQRK